MVELTLAVVGFWLIVLVLHFEIRKREVEVALVAHRERHQRAQERLRLLEEELEREAEAAEETDPDGPTPSEVAAMVTDGERPPLEVDPPDPIVEDVQTLSRDNPELAAAAIRRLVDQDPRPKRMIY